MVGEIPSTDTSKFSDLQVCSALEVLYQLIKYQCLGTDDPRLVTFDMQVLFIIIFDMNHEFYIQILFWFLAGGSQDVQSEVGRMRKNYCQGQRYPKEGLHVKDVDYSYTKGGYGEPDRVWVYPHYLLWVLKYIGPTEPGSI